MKRFMKKYLPQPLFYVVRSVVDKGRSLYAYNHDRSRFMRYYTFGSNSDDKINTEAHIIFHTHQIEKGLSHADFRDGFGRDVLAKLRDSLGKIDDHKSTAYVAALSAIKAYIDIHNEREYDLSECRNILGRDIVEEALACKSDVSGYSVMSKLSKKDNKSKNFKELFNNRFTVREFSDEPVDVEKVYEAVELSTKTPTVCNRQSFRVLVIKDPQVIKQALSVQNGFRGYDYPPVLSIVLTDARAFRGVTERNNQYIDGGSFMMSFLLGLEYVGLAACPLNTMFSIKEEKKARKILGLEDNYNFIAYVAIGNFRDSNKVAKSFRFPADEIIVEVK